LLQDNTCILCTEKISKIYNHVLCLSFESTGLFGI